MPIKMPEVGIVIDHAKNTFKKLKENHPDLRCYLVFSSKFGQGGLKPGVDLFNEFPEMFEPEDLVGQIKSEVYKKKKLTKQIVIKSGELEKKMRDLKGNLFPIDQKEIQELKDQASSIDKTIHDLSQGLMIKEDVFVELRFEQLNFEIISRVKKDPLINQNYTDPGDRSIRLVLFRVNDINDC